MDEFNEDIDFSWIKEQEKLQNIQKNYCKEPNIVINLYFIYINKNKYIDNILNEKQKLFPPIDNKGSYLSKEYLLKIIQSKKKKTPNSKYKFQDILYYNVDLEPEHIQSYSKNEKVLNVSNSFFKVIPIVDDIHFPDSIFIFHDINSLFFIFQEIEILSNRMTLKSILKSDKVENKNLEEDVHRKLTKKVQIQIGMEKTQQINKYNMNKTFKKHKK